MINTGDMVVNPSTGERLIFRQTSADTGGRLVEVEAIITPDGACAGAHVHPNQEERFQVIDTDQKNVGHGGNPCGCAKQNQTRDDKDECRCSTKDHAANLDDHNVPRKHAHRDSGKIKK